MSLITLEIETNGLPVEQAIVEIEDHTGMVVIGWSEST